jgi:DNA-binding response OmpR family regulator
MLSANVMEEHVAASLAAGADRHLPKPFEVPVLLRAIDALVASAEGSGAAPPPMKRAAPG